MEDELTESKLYCSSLATAIHAVIIITTNIIKITPIKGQNVSLSVDIA